MNLIKKINSKNTKIGVSGLGYVGLSLLIEFHEIALKADLNNVKVVQA